MIACKFLLYLYSLWINIKNFFTKIHKNYYTFILVTKINKKIKDIYKIFTHMI